MTFPVRHPGFAAIICSLVLCGCEFFVDAGTRIERAEASVAAGEYRAAAIELVNAVQSEPANIRARLLLADVSLRLGDPKSAENEIQAAAASGAPKADLAELRARLLLANRQFEGLLTELDANNIALSEPALSTYRGLALHGLRRFDAAQGAFEHALQTDEHWHRARIGLAESLAAQGESDDALQELKKVLAAEPQNATASAMLGALLMRRGDPEEAILSLNAARRSAPGQLDATQYTALLAALVEAHLASGDAPAAKSTHGDLVKRAPDSPITLLLAARIAMAEQNYTAAIAAAQGALKSAPQLPQAKLLLGAALLATGSYNQAEVEVSELLRQAPENIEARKLLAQIYLKLQSPEKAAQVLESAKASYGDDAQLDAMLGLARLESGEEEAAIALMERSLNAQPSNSTLKLDLSLAYLRSGQNEKAVALLRSLEGEDSSPRRDALLIAAAAAGGAQAGAAEVERAVAANPKSIPVLNLAASYFAQLHDYSRAHSYVAKALEIDPANGTSLMNGARIQLAAGEVDAAKAMLKKAVAANPRDSAARTALAQIAFRAGQRDEAIRILEDVRRSDAAASEPRLLLAGIYLQQNKRREADDLIREAWNAAEDKASVSSAIGRLLLQAGRYDEALPRLREAVELDQSDPQHRMNLAWAQQALGDDEAARASINRALSLRPNWIVPNAALVMLDAREGKVSDARKRVEELKKAHAKDPAISVLEGDLAVSLGAYEDAARAFARAFAMSPSGAVAMREYRARRLGKLADPTAPLIAWLKTDPDDANVRLALAEHLASSGKAAAAMEQYEHIVRDARPNPAALNNLAWMYYEAGDSRAQATAKRAYELAAHVPAIADTYGWILVRSGKTEEGLAILKRAAAGAAAAPDIRYHYAAALHEIGNTEEARKELRSLLEAGQPFAEADAARDLLGKLED
jgi:putative PEP-CTERM system TPR-repeat lipoprotein